MSERTAKFILWVIICSSFFFLGVGVGNTVTRILLRTDQARMRRSDVGFCSLDGKIWWKARADGTCYAMDEPR